MADNFGLKIGIEGEKEFKKALSEINQSFKVLGSEMKLVSSQFDKNDKSIQALSARNTVLNKEIDAPAPEDRNAAGCPPECRRFFWGERPQDAELADTVKQRRSRLKRHGAGAFR